MPNRLLLFLSLITVSGFAQVRTFVSTSGLDSNPCTRAEPCRNFNAAVAVVAQNGETVVLDSGGYGPAIIGKSVSIIAPDGIHAAIAPTSGHAIQIIGGTRVQIRNLYVKNQGSAQNGIQIDSGVQLFIEKTFIQGFDNPYAGGGFGIRTQTPITLYLSEVAISNCYTGASLASSSLSPIFVERCRFDQNGNHGLAIMDGSGARAVVQDSIFTGNGLSIQGSGLFAGSEGTVEVERCTFARNWFGLGTSPSSGDEVIDVSNSFIVFNAYAVGVAPGDAINSRGNNTVRGNNFPAPFTNTFPPM